MVNEDVSCKAIEIVVVAYFAKYYMKILVCKVLSNHSLSGPSPWLYFQVWHVGKIMTLY